MKATSFPYFFKLNTFTALAAALSHPQAPCAWKETVLGKGQPGAAPGTRSQRCSRRLAPLGRAPHSAPQQQQLRSDMTPPDSCTHQPQSASATAPSRRRRLQMRASFRPGSARPPPSRESAALPPRGTRPAVAMATGRSGWRCPARAACARLGALTRSRRLTGCSSLAL